MKRRKTKKIIIKKYLKSIAGRNRVRRTDTHPTYNIFPSYFRYIIGVAGPKNSQSFSVIDSQSGAVNTALYATEGGGTETVFKAETGLTAETVFAEETAITEIGTGTGAGAGTVEPETETVVLTVVFIVRSELPRVTSLILINLKSFD